MFEIINLVVTALRLAKYGTGKAVQKKRSKDAVKEFVNGGGAQVFTDHLVVERRSVLTNVECTRLQSGLSDKEAQVILRHAEERERRAPNAAWDAQNKMNGATA